MMFHRMRKLRPYFYSDLDETVDTVLVVRTLSREVFL